MGFARRGGQVAASFGLPASLLFVSKKRGTKCGLALCMRGRTHALFVNPLKERPVGPALDSARSWANVMWPFEWVQRFVFRFISHQPISHEFSVKFASQCSLYGKHNGMRSILHIFWTHFIILWKVTCYSTASFYTSLLMNLKNKFYALSYVIVNFLMFTILRALI